MSQMEAAKELVEREVLATQTKNTVVINDGSNEVSIPGFPYIFVAKGDKVLVSVDVFKSGYECRECIGKGRIKEECICESGTRPGFKYDVKQLEEVKESIGPGAANTRAQIPCSFCGGDYLSKRVDKVCPACEGKGALLFIADQSKVLPTTGVVVSLGENVDPRLNIKLHDRILFSAYVGQMVPTKAPGVVFKIIRDIEILCQIKGGEELAAFDFVTVDKEM